MTKAERLASARKLFNDVRSFRMKLTEDGGMGLPDRPFDDELITYRQALRDLPESSTIDMDENGQLTGIDWPNIPLRYFIATPGAKKEHPE